MGWPAYTDLLRAGTISQKAEEIYRKLESCDLCPRNCQTNRIKGELGSCGVGELAWVSSYGPHHGEEAPLRGRFGSGTIFFSGCNLSCVYCQNADISQRLSGRPVSPKKLSSLMLELQASSSLPPAPDPLTAREVEVLRLIAKGLTNNDIADLLVVGAGTVRSHVSNILSKLHLANRTQAALYALREGLASLEDEETHDTK